MPARSSPCLECGGSLGVGETCADFFNQMLYWENEDPALGDVHHLMVLCYHLQHPSLFSREGLDHGRQLLREFIEGGLTPETVRRNAARSANSGARSWSITTRPGNAGAYDHPIAWRLTAADVVAGGPKHYRGNVRAWAESIYQKLRSS